MGDWSYCRVILSSAVIMASKWRCFKGLRQIFLYHLKAKLLKVTLLENSYSLPAKFTTNQLLGSNDNILMKLNETKVGCTMAKYSKGYPKNTASLTGVVIFFNNLINKPNRRKADILFFLSGP